MKPEKAALVGVDVHTENLGGSGTQSDSVWRNSSIEIQNVEKDFAIGSRGRRHSLKALVDINLTIARGEFLALLGPSGCGKSTLLHILDGLSVSRGSVRVHGRKVTGPGFDRGMVFQEYALFPWRTVMENVAFGLETKGVPRRQRRKLAQDRISLVGLAGFENRFPDQLSGGMKQRVAIARALAFDPQVLLLDEPFAALDAQTRETLQEELLRIWERTGKTVVFVTHSMEEAAFLAQRVAIMTPRPGRIKAIVDIELPAPRYAIKDLRSTAEFAAVRHRLWELLSDA